MPRQLRLDLKNTLIPEIARIGTLEVELVEAQVKYMETILVRMRSYNFINC